MLGDYRMRMDNRLVHCHYVILKCRTPTSASTSPNMPKEAKFQRTINLSCYVHSVLFPLKNVKIVKFDRTGSLGPAVNQW